MAFLLLAASARDDTILFLRQGKKRRSPSRTRHSTAHEDDADSCSSLPKNWTSSLRDHSHKYSNSLILSWKSYFSRPASSSDATTWRQRRRVRQAAKEIQSAVQARLEEAPFLAPCQQNESEGDSSVSQESTLVLGREEVTVRYWLGRGGFCDVWKVAPIGDTKVVFKHLKTSLLPQHHHSLFSHSHSSSSNLVQGAIDLRMEALYLSQLAHPNIIQLRGVVQPQQGLPYGDGHYDGFGLLLEPLSDTLDQRLLEWRREAMGDMDESSCRHHQAEPLHLEQVLNYASQLADALHYLHERRIVMCDAKPTNVGFTQDDTVKLFDFGMCRELPVAQADDEDPHRLYTLPLGGTPIYMPPEVLIQRKYNCQMDVYSFAMVLYEMVSLVKPYEGLSLSQHYQRVAQKGERPPLDDRKVPTALHSLLQHAWASDVTERWTMQEVREELDRVRVQMGFSIQPQQVVPCHPPHRRISSMHSLLLHGRTAQVDVDGPEKDKDYLERPEDKDDDIMTADEFESYFADYHHALPTKTTWRVPCPV